MRADASGAAIRCSVPARLRPGPAVSVPEALPEFPTQFLLAAGLA
jgi:hypothetical protein